MAAAVLLMGLLNSCGGAEGTGPSNGLTLVVEMASGGVALDPNGYLLVSPDTTVQLVSNGTQVIEYHEVPEAVWVTDIRANCTLAGDTLLALEPDDGFATAVLSFVCRQLWQVAVATDSGVLVFEEFSDDFPIASSVSGTELAWRPDGTILALRSGVDEISVFDTSGTAMQVTDCHQNSNAARWSPDGTWISFLSMPCSSAISTVSLYASQTGELSDVSDTLDVVEVGAWSPQSTFLTYSAMVGQEEYDLYAAFPDGRDPILLTNLPGREIHSSVSPDGLYIVFSSELNGTFDIFRVFVVTGGIEQLTGNASADETHPTVSPSGSRIAYLQQGNDGNQVLVVEPLSFSRRGTD